MDSRAARFATSLLRRLDPRPALDAAWIAAVVLAAAVTSYLLTRHSARAPVPTPTPRPAAVAQAENWIRANVPRDTPLSADPEVATDLGSYGFTTAHIVAPGQLWLNWKTDTFVVVTPAIHDIVSRNLERAGKRAATAPVALFGGAADRAEVRLIVRASASSLHDRLAVDARDRAAAGAALARNPRVALDRALRAALRRGQLDMRAAAVLALLAARTDVRVAGVGTYPAEAAAGRPARMLMLRLHDPQALAATLRALPATYAPARVTPQPGGRTRLEWGVGLAPLPVPS